MPLLSIVVPCYNEQETISLFYEAVEAVRPQLDCALEYIFVDDGSKDNTLPILRALSEQDNNVKYYSFSRNFGKEAAMYAGLKNATGDYVVVMDVDLQHPPSFLPAMYEVVATGTYDCAAARRTSRKGESPIRSWFAVMFYRIINKMIPKVEIVDGASDYRLMSRAFVNSVLELAEYNRFSKGLFAWVGYKTKYFEYENVERSAGETKWSFWSLLLYSFEGIFAFTTAPLAISAFVGLFFCFVSLILIVVYAVKTLLFGDPVAGFPTTICAIFGIGGLQLFCLGIVSQYLGKMYLEIKKRPIFIIGETNDEAKKEV